MSFLICNVYGPSRLTACKHHFISRSLQTLLFYASLMLGPKEPGTKGCKHEKYGYNKKKPPNFDLFVGTIFGFSGSVPYVFGNGIAILGFFVRYFPQKNIYIYIYTQNPQKFLLVAMLCSFPNV